jgi:hypothetical protein
MAATYHVLTSPLQFKKIGGVPRKFLIGFARIFQRDSRCYLESAIGFSRRRGPCRQERIKHAERAQDVRK